MKQIDPMVKDLISNKEGNNYSTRLILNLVKAVMLHNMPNSIAKKFIMNTIEVINKQDNMLLTIIQLEENGTGIDILSKQQISTLKNLLPYQYQLERVKNFSKDGFELKKDAKFDKMFEISRDTIVKIKLSSKSVLVIFVMEENVADFNTLMFHYEVKLIRLLFNK
jgi:hypothetical protein